ncbi:MAG: hemerythrin family protein [Gammaproteobacteria bacterium]|nr:hemerythrin family protein [Gammaproteobacteria bacterium]
MPVVWQKKFQTGNELIDQDHKYLICLFNSIELALSKPDLLPHLPMFFEQLVEFSKEHFTREEGIQQKIGYPNHSAHKLEHKRILEHLQLVNQQIDKVMASGIEVSDGDVLTDMLGSDLMDLARQWVIDHLLKADRDLVPYLEKFPARFE